MLFVILHQLEDQVKSLGFGKAFDPGQDLDTKLAKDDALVDGYHLIDRVIHLITLQLVYN